MTQITGSCAVYSVVPSVHIPVNTVPLTLTKAQSTLRKGRHNHQKIFRGVHEIFLSSKHQSESAMFISPAHQFHPYFPENSPLLGDKFLYYFLVSPWSIIFVSRERNNVSHDPLQKQLVYYLFFPHCKFFSICNNI